MSVNDSYLLMRTKHVFLLLLLFIQTYFSLSHIFKSLILLYSLWVVAMTEIFVWIFWTGIIVLNEFTLLWVQYPNIYSSNGFFKMHILYLTRPSSLDHIRLLLSHYMTESKLGSLLRVWNWWSAWISYITRIQVQINYVRGQHTIATPFVLNPA